MNVYQIGVQIAGLQLTIMPVLCFVSKWSYGFQPICVLQRTVMSQNDHILFCVKMIAILL